MGISMSASKRQLRLEVFKNLFASVAEEMGLTLQRSAPSPNIKERRDYSCSIFDSQVDSMPLPTTTHLRTPACLARAIARSKSSKRSP